MSFASDLCNTVVFWRVRPAKCVQVGERVSESEHLKPKRRRDWNEGVRSNLAVQHHHLGVWVQLRWNVLISRSRRASSRRTAADSG